MSNRTLELSNSTISGALFSGKEPGMFASVADLNAAKRASACLYTRRAIEQAFFNAASLGDEASLDHLLAQVDLAQSLIDPAACDNALWVAVAENHSDFAIKMLQNDTVRDKISVGGIRESIRIALVSEQKQLINALLSLEQHKLCALPNRKVIVGSNALAFHRSVG